MKITSEVTCILSILLVVGLGFIKVKIPMYPLEIVATSIVALAVALFTKRVAPRVVSAWKRGDLSND